MDGLCKIPDSLLPLLVHEGLPTAPVPAAEDAHVLQAAVAAEALNALLPQVGSPLRGIAAGRNGGHPLTAQQGRTLLCSVILLASVNGPVQQSLHGRCAEECVNWSGQNNSVTVHHSLKNLLKIVLLNTARPVQAVLTGLAPQAGAYLLVTEPDRLGLHIHRLALLQEGAQQGGGVPISPEAAHQHAEFHRNTSRNRTSVLILT